jgi:hypothetical protein
MRKSSMFSGVAAKLAATLSSDDPVDVYTDTGVISAKQARRNRAKARGDRPVYPSTKTRAVVVETPSGHRRTVVEDVPRRDPHSYPLGGNARVSVQIAMPTAPKARRVPLVAIPTHFAGQGWAAAVVESIKRRALVAGGGIWWRDRAGRLRLKRLPGVKKMAAAKAGRSAYARAKRSLVIAATLAGAGKAAAS